LSEKWVKKRLAKILVLLPISDYKKTIYKTTFLQYIVVSRNKARLPISHYNPDLPFPDRY